MTPSPFNTQIHLLGYQEDSIFLRRTSRVKGDLGYSGLRPSTVLYLLYKWHRLLGKHWTTTKEVLFWERERERERDGNHTYVKWEHSKRAWDTAGLESGPRTQTESLHALKRLTAGLETTTVCEPDFQQELGWPTMWTTDPKKSSR